MSMLLKLVQTNSDGEVTHRGIEILDYFYSTAWVQNEAEWQALTKRVGGTITMPFAEVNTPCTVRILNVHTPLGYEIVMVQATVGVYIMSDTGHNMDTYRPN